MRNRTQWLPVATTGVAVLTYFTCGAWAVASGAYIGGMSWPYISDLGREPPRYAIFVIGLTLTAIGASCANVIFYRETFARPAKACCAPADVSLAGVVLVVASAPFLFFLAVFPTIEFPVVHDVSAYIFFALQTTSIITQTVALARHPWSTPLKVRVQKLRNVLAAMYVVFFIIYIPVGLAVNCAWGRLSMDDCINTEQLGETYCRNLQLDSDPSSTKLWDYSGCPATNNMRSIAQTLCVMVLVIYYGSFTANLSEPEPGREPRVAAPAAAEEGASAKVPAQLR